MEVQRIRWFLALLSLCISPSLGCPVLSNSNLGEQETLRTLVVMAKPVGDPFEFPARGEMAVLMNTAREFFLEASYEKIKLTGSSDPDIAADLFGPLEVPLALVACQEAEFVEAAINDQLDASLDLVAYDRLVFVAPAVQQAGCLVHGFPMGAVQFERPDGPATVRSVFVRAQSLDVVPALIVHQLGHELDGMPLTHAAGMDCVPGTLQESGCPEGELLDLLDPMGLGIFMGHFNPFFKEQLGWLKEKSVFEVDRSGFYFLAATEMPLFGPKLIKVPRQANQSFYLEYRTPTGFNDLPLSGQTDGVVIRLVRNDVPYLLKASESGEFALTENDAPFTDERGNQISVMGRGQREVLLSIQLAPDGERVPPQIELAGMTFLANGDRAADVRASDASGIAKLELYAVDPVLTGLGWTEFEPIGVLEPSDAFAGSYRVPVDMEFSVPGEVRMYAHDRSGNVAFEQLGISEVANSHTATLSPAPVEFENVEVSGTLSLVGVTSGVPAGGIVSEGTISESALTLVFQLTSHGPAAIEAVTLVADPQPVLPSGTAPTGPAFPSSIEGVGWIPSQAEPDAQVDVNASIENETLVLLFPVTPWFGFDGGLAAGETSNRFFVSMEAVGSAASPFFTPMQLGVVSEFTPSPFDDLFLFPNLEAVISLAE